MIRRLTYAFLLTATMNACAAEQKTEQTPRPQRPRDAVARIGGQVVLISELACPPHVDVGRCPAVRQEKFDRRARELLIDAAARLHDLSVSEEVLNRHMPQLSAEEIRAADEMYKRHARAALRVRQGEDKEAVYRRDLAPHGVSMEQFDSLLRKLPDVASAQRALALDFAEQTRRHYADDTRRRILEEQLGRLVDGRRLSAGGSFDVAAERFWNDVVVKTDSVVFDPTLRMPRMEGVLKP